jgi:putative ATP-binding cassette transporter
MTTLGRFLLQRAKAVFVFVLATGLISGICNVAFIRLVQRSLVQPLQSTHAALWMLVMLCILAPGVRLISQILQIKVTEEAMADLVIQLSRQILATPLKQLEEIGSHRLLAVLTEDVVSLAGGLMNVPIVLSNGVIVFGCFWYLATISGAGMLLVLGFLVLAGVSIWIGSMKGLIRFREARTHLDATFGDLRTLTLGIKELKLHARRRAAFIADQLEEDTRLYRRKSLIARAIFASAGGMGQFFFYILLVLQLFVLPSAAGASRAIVTVFILTLLFVMASIEAMWNSIPELGRAGVALSKIESLGLELTPRHAQGLQVELHPTVPDLWQLQCVGVTHAYRTDQDERSFMLGPVDFTLWSSEIVFIVGANGSGKTTFAKILTGLYSPEQGAIYLNGKAVSESGREAYRQNFSAVFSDFYLFDRLLGLNCDGLDERAKNYLVALQLDNKVNITDGVLSTLDLSQGQRKRLALLTAYLEDRPAYVFDEWAADQDPQFREVFYTKLLPDLKSRSKAVVVITHDDRYSELADRVITIENGVVVGMTTKADLAAQRVGS